MAQGYGVAGHKNAFTGAIRCGNWVEDMYGADIDAAGPVASSAKDFVTENSLNYVGAQPTEEADPNAGLSAAAAQCTPRGILFTHGDLNVVSSPFAEYAPFGTPANAYSATELIRQKAAEAEAEVRRSRAPAQSTAAASFAGARPAGGADRPKGRDGSFSKTYAAGAHVVRR
jgi:hypothetical protein